MKYVLITPAHNEEAFIEKTLEAMIAQTVLPLRWVIVDDGSTDATAQIVERYAARFAWIDLLRRPQRLDRSFTGKANAFNAGLDRVQSLHFDVIGNLDADISFGSDYFEVLLRKFAEYPRLGVAGTPMRETNHDPLKDTFYHFRDVFGACQIFRRECFEEVGGYTPIEFGGIDWIAVRTARLKGWETRSFPERIFFHHRPMGQTDANVWKARFDYGRKDYFLGNHPLWQLFRVGYQMLKPPYVIGGLILGAGYMYSLLARVERPVTADLVELHRQEQLERLKNLFTQFAKTGQLKTEE
jgi:glycosyltransferase involved in cell wall biosynthesis